MARLYLTILNHAIDGKPLKGGKAYYAAVDGEIVSNDFLTRSAQSLHEFGLVNSSAVTEITQEDLDKVFSG